MGDLGEFAFANCREVRYNQESAVVKKIYRLQHLMISFISFQSTE